MKTTRLFLIYSIINVLSHKPLKFWRNIFLYYTYIGALSVDHFLHKFSQPWDSLTKNNSIYSIDVFETEGVHIWLMSSLIYWRVMTLQPLTTSVTAPRTWATHTSDEDTNHVCASLEKADHKRTVGLFLASTSRIMVALLYGCMLFHIYTSICHLRPS